MQNSFLSLLKISPDPDDADFIALALKAGFPLWSNDRRLKGIEEITVLNTEDVVNFVNRYFGFLRRL